MTRKRLSAEFTPGEDPGSALARLLGETDDFAAAAMLAPRDRERLAIIVEELASNAARHGMDPRGVCLTVTLSADEAAIAMQVEDDGAPFDPTTGPAFAGPYPDTGGGVGLELVRAWCDPLVYSRKGGTNRLSLQLRRAERG